MVELEAVDFLFVMEKVHDEDDRHGNREEDTYQQPAEVEEETQCYQLQ